MNYIDHQEKNDKIWEHENAPKENDWRRSSDRESNTPEERAGEEITASEFESIVGDLHLLDGYNCDNARCGRCCLHERIRESVDMENIDGQSLAIISDEIEASIIACEVDADGSCPCAFSEDCEIEDFDAGFAAEDDGSLVMIVGVRLRGRGKTYHFSPAGLEIQTGDHVIVETSQGMEIGIASDNPQEVPKSSLKSPLKDVLRLASNDDLRHYEENKVLEEEAAEIARERIADYQLEMSLVDVEYRFDNRKITFYFTADGRVDFRELVRDLASVFRTRIELRQIGVRDEACMIGGLAICGRELCCSTFLKDFKPVSIRMAKDQNLSMNPSKISGACGRLLCCLNYEHEAYVDAKKRMPKKNARVMTPEGSGVVEDIDLLREKVSVRLDRDTDPAVVSFPADQLETKRTRDSDESHKQKRKL